MGDTVMGADVEITKDVPRRSLVLGINCVRSLADIDVEAILRIHGMDSQKLGPCT